MLKVTIHCDHHVAAAMVQAGSQCYLMPEIPAQAQAFNLLILRMQGANLIKSCVAASVINKNNFIAEIQ